MHKSVLRLKKLPNQDLPMEALAALGKVRSGTIRNWVYQGLVKTTDTKDGKVITVSEIERLIKIGMARIEP